MNNHSSRLWSWPVFFTTLGCWTGYFALSLGGLGVLGEFEAGGVVILYSLAAQVIPLCILASPVYCMIARGLRSDRRWAGLGTAAALFLAAQLVHGTAYVLMARHYSMVWMQSWWGMVTISLGTQYWLTFAACVAHAAYILRHEQKRELIAAQLRVLRAQLQPHFLFNTLHAIGVTAKTDGAVAARMTTLLGDMLRQTLEKREQPLVTLAEELTLLQPYLELQQLRFSDRLRVEQDLDRDTLGAHVPDLIIQPLVENAMHHGIECKPGSGRIRILSRRHGNQLVLEVQDDGAGLKSKSTHTGNGTGLSTTRERLMAMFGKEASLDVRGNDMGGTTATLRLPYSEIADAA